MAIRLPLQTVLNATVTDAAGAASVNGGYAFPFQIPMDTDNVVVKLTASVSGGVSAVFQTSDDGGSTYYDVARTSIVSNAPNQNAEWLSIPVIGSTGSKVIPSLVAPGSIVGVTGGAGGRAAASTLSAGTTSGLPILSTQNRIFVIYSAVTANSIVTVQVKANSQSATA